MKLRTMLYGLTLMLGCFVLASCVNDAEGAMPARRQDTGGLLAGIATECSDTC